MKPLFITLILAGGLCLNSQAETVDIACPQVNQIYFIHHDPVHPFFKYYAQAASVITSGNAAPFPIQGYSNTDHPIALEAATYYGDDGKVLNCHYSMKDGSTTVIFSNPLNDLFKHCEFISTQGTTCQGNTSQCILQCKIRK